MKNKKLLTVILLSLSFCFVFSGVGYGEISEWLNEHIEVSVMDIWLAEAQVKYIMSNPRSFLKVSFFYDKDGELGKAWGLPKTIDTSGKLAVTITNNRGEFYGKSGDLLLNLFKAHLLVISLDLGKIITDRNTDIVAMFYDGGLIPSPLGYFNQGEYYLWED